MRKRAIWMIFFVCLIFGGSSVKVNGDMSNIEINQMFCINAYYSESEDKCIIFWDKIEDAKKYELYIRCGDEFIKVNESYNEQSCLDLNQFEDMDIYDIRIIAYLNNKIQKSFVMSFEMFENNKDV